MVSSSPAFRGLRAYTLVTLLLITLAGPSLAGSPRAELRPASEVPIDLIYQEGAAVQEMYRALGKAFRVEVLFDPKMQDLPSAVPILRHVDLFEALERLTTSHGHFYKVLDEKTLLVADDTPQNRRTYEEQTIQSFYLEDARVADAMTLLRSLLGLKHIAANETNRTLTVRDTADTVAVAADLIASFDHPPAEVVLDLQLIEIDPEALDSVLRGDALQRLTPAQLEGLADHGQRVGTSQLATLEGRRGRLELGENLPISIPSQDAAWSRLGLQLEARPQVHGDSGEVGLELELTVHGVTAWVGPTTDRLPMIGDRKLEASLRLTDGASWVVRGFFSTTTGAPPKGFDDLPPLARWLTGQLPEGREMVLVLTPRVVRGPGHTAGDLRPQWIGTETNIVHHGAGGAVGLGE